MEAAAPLHGGCLQNGNHNDLGVGTTRLFRGEKQDASFVDSRSQLFCGFPLANYCGPQQAWGH